MRSLLETRVERRTRRGGGDGALPSPRHPRPRPLRSPPAPALRFVITLTAHCVEWNGDSGAGGRPLVGFSFKSHQRRGVCAARGPSLFLRRAQGGVHAPPSPPLRGRPRPSAPPPTPQLALDDAVLDTCGEWGAPAGLAAPRAEGASDLERTKKKKNSRPARVTSSQPSPALAGAARPAAPPPPPNGLRRSSLMDDGGGQARRARAPGARGPAAGGGGVGGFWKGGARRRCRRLPLAKLFCSPLSLRAPDTTTATTTLPGHRPKRAL